MSPALILAFRLVGRYGNVGSEEELIATHKIGRGLTEGELEQAFNRIHVNVDIAKQILN